MFEKEAEDKAFEKYPLSSDYDSIAFERNIKYEEGFKDGAEFGYSKAVEWHDLRKNPDDIPHEESGQLYLLYWRLGSIDGYSVVRKIVNPLKDVIAWCRVPCYGEATGREFKMIVCDELEVPTGDNG